MWKNNIYAPRELCVSKVQESFDFCQNKMYAFYSFLSLTLQQKQMPYFRIFAQQKTSTIVVYEILHSNCKNSGTILF